MRFSKRSLEGYLMIDHRNSPGVTPEEAAGFGPAVPGGQLYESATNTCGHCMCEVVLNPQRTRERGYCPKCDQYLCDACEYVRAQTFQCEDYDRKLDDLQRALEQQPLEVPLALRIQKGLL